LSVGDRLVGISPSVTPVTPSLIPCQAPEHLAGSSPDRPTPPQQADRPGPREIDGENKGENKGERAVAGQSIRVNAETLKKLMTMVSELVLTRNQLLEIVRRLEDSEFKAPLQRLSNVTAELQEGVMKARMQPIGHAARRACRCRRCPKARPRSWVGGRPDLRRHAARPAARLELAWRTQV
jgi:chemotaxis protein histidine kinase CheA